ncbi:MAG: alpha/beta hydrolase [Polyangiales bacterium]
MRWLALLLLTACSTVRATSPHQLETASGRVEVGSIEGAPYRIDVPARWNGQLFLYCHGYGGPPRAFDPRADNELAQLLTSEGIAVAQSEYARGGYAVVEGTRDTERLRAYFGTRFGSPSRTWVGGHSLGGSITMMLLETEPRRYDGGLAMCAPLGPATAYIKRLIFDPVVLFAAWFPDTLPSPVDVPADYTMSEQRAAAIAALLDGNEEASVALRELTTARTNLEMGRLLDEYVYILGELRQRWGANAFDNRDTVYTGLHLDPAVNDRVRRYEAAPHALRELSKAYTPTARLERPLLALRTVYDPLISAFDAERYTQLAQRAGTTHLFAQKYVLGEGHCAIRGPELLSALRELTQWRERGARPTPGRLR